MSRRYKAIALRLTLTLALFPIVPILSATPASAVDTAANLLCQKNASDGTNVEVSYVPGFCIVKFKSGTVTWTAPASVSYIQYIVVAGGGAGGRGDSASCEGGGGGGGGVLTGYKSITPGTGYSITVGAGGDGSQANPQSGANSSAFDLTAIGGGFGGYGTSNGGSGGSGGGGTHDKRSGGNGTSGQGFAGETPVTASTGGGGGGASAPGQLGYGGLGLGSAITGSTVFYGDGGGASRQTRASGTQDGMAGGSGNGGIGSTAINVAPTAGAANTGGGGGGMLGCDNTKKGANGGSGVVIVRYAAVPSVNGLMGYFNNDSTSPTTVMKNALTTGPEYCHSGVYATVNPNWNTGGPTSIDGSNYTHDPLTCTADYFNGYFYGYIKAPVTGTITFRITADDNFVLVVDSATVINRDTGGATTLTGTLDMKQDAIYPVQISFQEMTGNAAIDFRWSYTGQSEVTIPTQYLGTTVGAISTVAVQNTACQIGSSQSCPAFSPQEIVNIYGTTSSGTYWLLVNGVSTNVYLMMGSDFDGGGYVLAMKGANTGTEFQYDASHWTKPTVLNPTGANYLSRNSSNNTDAKFNTFNYLPATSIAAVFPEMTSTSNAAGPMGANNSTYGFSWRETMTANASSYLQLFSDSNSRQEILNGTSTRMFIARQKIRQATDTDIGKTSGNTGFFTRAANIKWYGFNYRARDWNFQSGFQRVRWGFGNNENGDGNEDSNDSNGGIGLSGFNTWSAGDTYNSSNNVIVTGVNSQKKFEMYLKMADPNMSAPTSVASSTASNGDITLSWSKPSNSVPTEYLVQYRTGSSWAAADSTAFRVLMPSDSSTVSTKITGLSKSTKYEFRVFARAAYNNLLTNSSTASSVLARLPVTPNVRAFAAIDTSTALTVSFDAVSNADSYQVKVFSDETATVQVGTTWSSFTSGGSVTGLSPGTAYYVTVSAIGSGGYSTSSTSDPVRGVTNLETDNYLSLNGTTDFASIATSTIIPTASSAAYTVEAWIYPTSNSGTNVIVSQGTGSNRFYIKRASGFFTFYRDLGGLSTEISCGATPLNAWAHIAVSYTSGTYKCYIDGQDVTPAGTSVSATGVINGTFAIGNFSAALDGSHKFAGRIDEVKVWNTARTSVEIQADLHRIADVTSSALLAYFDMNEVLVSKISNRTRLLGSVGDLNISGAPSLVDVKSLTTLGAYTLVTFPRSYLTALGGWKVPTGIKRASALVVAGGGGGGYNTGGGGSGGGFNFVSSRNISNFETVTVGAGGLGAIPVSSAGNSNLKYDSTVGGNSLFGTLTSTGGNRGITFDVSQSGRSAGGASVVGSANSGAGGQSSGTSTQAGLAGGDGPSSSITSVSGTLTIYSAGGGGGGWGATASGGAGGSGGGGSGGISASQAGVSGSANTGGGGGGGSARGYSGGNGGSGIVIVRYITALAPIFTAPPTVDTTTAGMAYSFVTRGTPNSPLTRSYVWQHSTETGTANSWNNVQASTSETYTVTLSDTSTSGIRYQYRVVVTDSDTAGLSIVETSTIFYLKINPAILIIGSGNLNSSYGETATVTFTMFDGTGARSTVVSSNNQSYISWSSVSGDSATLSLEANLGYGTYFETMTVTDSVGAQAQLVVNINRYKASGLIVTFNTPSPLTYNETGYAGYSNTVTISGLVNGDTLTAVSPVNYSYRYTYGPTTCATGGVCALGDTGPGGGIVFYVNGSDYFEAAPKNWFNDIGYDNGVVKYCSDSNGNEMIAQTPASNQNDETWGGGLSNFNAFKPYCSTGAVGLVKDYATLKAESWYVPNKTELVGLITYLTTNGRRAEQFDFPIYDPFFWTSNATWDNDYFWELVQPYFAGSNINATLRSSNTTAYNNQSGKLIPIRKFVAQTVITSDVSGLENAGTYTVTPTLLNLISPATLDNYSSVTYVGNSLVINKKQPAGIKLPTVGVPGTALIIKALGGSGDGAESVTVTSGDCTVTGNQLSRSTAGTCGIRLVKRESQNYLSETATATVSFFLFTFSQPTNNIGGGGEIGVNGLNNVETRTAVAPVVTNFVNTTLGSGRSGSVGNTLTFTGKNFVLSSTVEFQSASGVIVVAAQNVITTNPDANTFTVVVPTGAVSGPLAVTNNVGARRTFPFTLL